MPSSRVKRLMLALVPLAIVGASAPGAAAGPIDVCKLVSGAEVAAATGVAVGTVAARTPTSAEIGACEYRHADTKQFGTSIVAATSIYRAEKIAVQDKIWTDMFPTKPVAGLGDLARHHEAGSAIYVRKGAKAVYVQVLDNKGGSAARLGVLKTIAAKLLAKS